MKYRRKSDGVIVDATWMAGFVHDRYRIIEKGNSVNSIYIVSDNEFERDYEKIEEEKPMLVKMNCKECGKEHVVSDKAGYMCLTCSIKLNLGEGYQKPMHNFKVGDRVNIYWGANLQKGIILSINHYLLDAQVDSGNQSAKITVHYKQCRKLKKKERMRIWIKNEMCAMLSRTTIQVTAVSQVKPEDGEWTEFVEVRKK